MTEFWLFFFGLICLEICILPVTIYLCVKGARLAWLRADQLFESDNPSQQKDETNGNPS